MYYVWVHLFGRKVISTGPMSGCYGLMGHEHKCDQKYRKKADAIAAADAVGCRAVVYKGQTERIYDNGKEPGARMPNETEGERYARIAEWQAGQE